MTYLQWLRAYLVDGVGNLERTEEIKRLIKYAEMQEKEKLQ